MSREYEIPAGYAQVCLDEKVPKGKRRKRNLTPMRQEEIRRKVRMIRSAGTIGFRMDFRDFCDALGHTGGAARKNVRRYLIELDALEVVYFPEDEMWTGGC